MSIADAVPNYLATWNADDPDRLLAEYWSPDATYTDPMAQAAGTAEIAALIRQVRTQFPGYVFTAFDDADAHHRQVRFRWGLGPAGAEPVVIGFDVLVIDDAGRIRDVRGFLDKVPA
ncbi:nuclear transport factor 2 family protein [Gordonia sinesedis]